MNNQLILVNDHDDPIGEAGKIEAHINGWLHRAFSVFIFNNRGEFLLQQRSHNKYHSQGLWSNACCSHPHPGDNTFLAATNRLKEEMGLTVKLDYAFATKYFVVLNCGMIEHEYDHVFVGITNDTPIINLEEAACWKYLSYKDLYEDIFRQPCIYTEWFKKLFPLISRIPIFKKMYNGNFSNYLGLHRHGSSSLAGS